MTDLDRVNVDREFLEQEGLFLLALIEASGTPEPLREKARERFRELDIWLAYSGRELDDAPALMVFCGYRQATEDHLAALSPELVEDFPVPVMLARYSAELADTPSFSDLYRLQCVDSLNQCLGTLARHAEEYSDIERVP